MGTQNFSLSHTRDKMREHFSQYQFFFFLYVSGLPHGSVHAVIAAQSFHWFANEKSLSEIQRVLVPGGKFGLVWNARDHSVPWVKEMDNDVILPLYE